MARDWSHGTTRQTLVVGQKAFKLAKNGKGLACNLFEFALYQRSNDERRQMLCPSIWVSTFGHLLIQAAADPLTDMMTVEEYLEMGSRWWHAADDGESDPFEPKASDWGKYEGRLVALDYANHALVFPDE